MGQRAVQWRPIAADRPYLAKVDRLTGQPENWETEFGYGYPGTVAIEALVADEEHSILGQYPPLFRTVSNILVDWTGRQESSTIGALRPIFPFRQCF